MASATRRREREPPVSGTITIVSGLPRSGTSVAMQMLGAGGVPILADDRRAADPDNPRGYYEFEPVLRLRSDRSWLELAVGKAVKIVHMLLMELPTDYDYRVILMRRDLAEVIRSQRIMLERSGRPLPPLEPARLAQVYENQLATVRRWLDERPAFRVLEVPYRELIADPATHASRIADFLDRRLDASAMIAAVDPTLYRNRGAPPSGASAGPS